jgi:hypothetical protein
MAISMPLYPPFESRKNSGSNKIHIPRSRITGSMELTGSCDSRAMTTSGVSLVVGNRMATTRSLMALAGSTIGVVEMATARALELDMRSSRIAILGSGS